MKIIVPRHWGAVALLPQMRGLCHYHTPAAIRWHFASQPPCQRPRPASLPRRARLARSGSGGPRHSRSCAANGCKRNLRPTVTTPLLPSARVQCSCPNSLSFASFVWTFWNALWNAAAPACTCLFCQLSRCASVEAANFWHMRAALKLFLCKLQSREQLPTDVYGRP